MNQLSFVSLDVVKVVVVPMTAVNVQIAVGPTEMKKIIQRIGYVAYNKGLSCNPLSDPLIADVLLSENIETAYQLQSAWIAGWLLAQKQKIEKGN